MVSTFLLASPDTLAQMASNSLPASAILSEISKKIQTAIPNSEIVHLGIGNDFGYAERDVLRPGVVQIAAPGQTDRKRSVRLRAGVASKDARCWQ